jgi:hypothetical protein
VQGALDTGAVVVTEAAGARGDVFDIGFTDFLGVKGYFSPGKADFRRATQVKDYLQQLAQFLLPAQRLAHTGWQNVEQGIEVIGSYLGHHNLL